MAGCFLGCLICETTYSKNRFERLLTHDEISDQIIYTLEDNLKYINPSTMVAVGFMGNGEPFGNIDNVIKAINITHNLYQTKITRYNLSTIGVNLKEGLGKLKEYLSNNDMTIWIQFSLFSLNEQIRNNILPKSLNLDKAIPLLDEFSRFTQSPIRYNIPFIKDINDSIEHLSMLKDFILESPDTRMLKISTYNDIVNKSYLPRDDEFLINVNKYLSSYNVNAELFFANRDNKIQASCGQMRENFMNNKL